MIKFSIIAALLFACTTDIQAQEPLTDSDFTLRINNQTVALGQPWDQKLIASLGASTGDDFVGEVPFNEVNYKFYRYTFAGFDIYSTNLWWDSYNRDIDRNIIGQISIHSPTLHTARGIAPGSAKDALINLYGPGETDSSDGEEWRGYPLGNKQLSFRISEGKVTDINMNYVND